MEFEKALKNLEKINEKMASGELGLKESIETFKKGVDLIEKCKKELKQAEHSVQKLIKVDEETGEVETEDFEADEE